MWMFKRRKGGTKGNWAWEGGGSTHVWMGKEGRIEGMEAFSREGAPHLPNKPTACILVARNICPSMSANSSPPPLPATYLHRGGQASQLRHLVLQHISPPRLPAHALLLHVFGVLQLTLHAPDLWREEEEEVWGSVDRCKG